MILFTKEVFMQLKSLTSMHIQVNRVNYGDQTPSALTENWSIIINGVAAGTNPGYDLVTTEINASSKEEAYRIFKELTRQLVDSGTLPELNNVLIEDVLKEK